MDTEGEDLGEVGEVSWYPDRTWHGVTFVPELPKTATGKIQKFVLRGGANLARQ